VNKMRLRNFLNEAVYKFSNSDINKIMDHLKKPREKIIELLKAGSADKLDDHVDDIREMLYIKSLGTYIIKQLDSSIFKSPPLTTAHKINPVNIYVGYTYSPHYNVHEKAIVVGIRLSSLEDNAAWKLSDLAGWYTMAKMRSDVVHEITHWLDDSFHKKFITKAFSGERFVAKYFKKGQKVYLDEPFEVNSIVNGISDMKKLVEVKFGKQIWDTLSWDDFLGMDPMLANLDIAYGAKFRKILRKRMAREKLLGKKMR